MVLITGEAPQVGSRRAHHSNTLPTFATFGTPNYELVKAATRACGPHARDFTGEEGCAIRRLFVTARA